MIDELQSDLSSQKHQSRGGSASGGLIGRAGEGASHGSQSQQNTHSISNPVHPNAPAQPVPMNINQPFPGAVGQQQTQPPTQQPLKLPEQIDVDALGLVKPNSEQFTQSTRDGPVETSLSQLFPTDIFGQEAAKARVGMSLGQFPAVAGNTYVAAAPVAVAPPVDMSCLETNILDKARIAKYQNKLHRNVGTNKAVTKISDAACVLLSEGLQLHAKSILDQCSTISRRRRHESLVSSYEHVARSLQAAQGVPQNYTRNNLALKFGVDPRRMLRAEEEKYRHIIKDRTRTWEADVLEQYKKDNEIVVPTGGRKRGAAVIDDNAPTASEVKWDAEQEAEAKGMLTWSQVAQLHFKDKLAQVHEMGPYLKSGKQGGGVANEKSSRKRMKQHQSAVAAAEQWRKEENERLAAKDASSSAAPPTTDDGTVDVAKGPSATVISGSGGVPATIDDAAAAAGTVNPRPSGAPRGGWTAEPCPLGGRTRDVISADDMKTVLSKFASAHPKCNYPLSDSTLVGRSFNRVVLFGLSSAPEGNAAAGAGRPPGVAKGRNGGQ